MPDHLPMFEADYVRSRDRPLLVKVSGPPGSDKSTLTGDLGARSCLPVVSRDALKGGICFYPPASGRRTVTVI